MGKKVFSSIIISLFVLSGIFMFSCSQNLPEAKYALPTVIFEYNTEDSLPKPRLSIFVESVSDVRRYSSISIKSIENNYVWDTDDIVKFRTGDRTYAGYANFVVPDGEEIPSGVYEITYINADDEKIDLRALVTYDSTFYQTKASEIPEYMKSKRGVSSIIIFNKNKEVMYFGEKREDLSNARKIWNKYKDAAFYQDVWSLSDNSVMCVMPLKEVVPE